MWSWATIASYRRGVESPASAGWKNSRPSVPTLYSCLGRESAVALSWAPVRSRTAKSVPTPRSAESPPGSFESPHRPIACLKRQLLRCIPSTANETHPSLGPPYGRHGTSLCHSGVHVQLAIHCRPQSDRLRTAISRTASACPPSPSSAVPPPYTSACAFSASAPATTSFAPRSPSSRAAIRSDYLGAEPVFLDSDRTTWNLDPNILEYALRQRAQRKRLPRAVIVVHLYGQCADMDPILAICRDYGIPVLEDAAEALGAAYRNRPAGTLGDVGDVLF